MGNVTITPLSEDVWELYNVNEDFSQANNLAASNPEKLKELQNLFDEEAVKNHVYPIDDRRSERFNPLTAGRPDLMGPRTQLTLYEGMEGIMENTFINIKNRSYTIDAEVEVPSNGNGVIISQAGRFGGWALYMTNGQVNHEYNFFGLQKTKISTGKIAPGRHSVKYEFIADEAKPATGGTCILYIDGNKVTEGQIPKTQPFAYSGDEVALNSAHVDEGVGATVKEKPSTIIKQDFIINASIDKAWAVLGPGFADIQKWASSAKTSSADDNQSLNGSLCTVRNVAVSGIGNVKEKLLQYSTSEHTIIYQVIEGNPKPVKYMVETWKLVGSGTGTTRLEVAVELRTGGFVGTVFKGALKRKISKFFSETAEELKYYVENDQPHPNKVKAASKTKT